MTPEVKKIIENQPEMFEKLLLCLIYSNREFYDQNCNYLCRAITLPAKMSNKKQMGNEPVAFIDDFSIPQHNALFHVIDTYYKEISTSKLKSSPINPAIFQLLVKNCAIESDKGINEDEIEEVSNLMADIAEMQENEDLLELVGEGFTYWFKRQRISRLTNEVGLRDDWDPDEIQSELTFFNRVLMRDTSEIKTQSFGEGIDTIRPNVDRFPTGIQSVDAVMGGGVAKKEHIMFIAPTGCGKTVMACQLGSSFAMARLKGIIITTEEEAEALELRIISSRCGIPFKMIKDGLNRDKLTQDQCDRVDELREAMDGHLFIREWSNSGSSENFEQELRAICEEFIDEHGSLDFLIFDWVGGALTKDISNNPNLVRIIYQLAADFLSDYAKEINTAVVSFAQAHPSQSLNKLKVDNTTISECKTMGNKVSYLVGITALFAEEADDETFSDDQWLYFSKGRKIKNMKIPITRKFDFQKFEDRARVRRN